LDRMSNSRVTKRKRLRLVYDCFFLAHITVSSYTALDQSISQYFLDRTLARMRH
jgi:hypothetical protein